MRRIAAWVAEPAPTLAAAARVACCYAALAACAGVYTAFLLQRFVI